MSKALSELESELRAKGCHGLYNSEGPCGCTWEDLAPCGECPIEMGCVGGYIGPADGSGFDICDYMLYPSKEAAKAAAEGSARDE